MSYLQHAKNQVLGAVNTVIHLPSPLDRAQTVTIACPVERVAQLWCDPDQLSVAHSGGDATECPPRRPRRKGRSRS